MLNGETGQSHISTSRMGTKRRSLMRLLRCDQRPQFSETKGGDTKRGDILPGPICKRVPGLEKGENLAMSTMDSIVNFVCANLSDLELVEIDIVAQADQDPRNRLFDYNKVSSLFTEAGGTRMHQETKDSLARVVLSRLA
jgi:hypothetical protein